MLENRDYMRSDYRPGGKFNLQHSVTYWLMGSLVVVFLIQSLDHDRHFGNLILSADGMSHGYFWQLFTFQFLHAGVMHIAFNLFSLWMFGRVVEERLGTAHFLKLYFLGGIAGGILQVLLGFIFPIQLGGGVVGASAGICALIAAFSIIEPDATILLFFALPMRAANLLYLSLAVSAISVVGAIAGMRYFMGVAHGAHLGGILFAMGYMRCGMNVGGMFGGWRPWKRKSGEASRSFRPRQGSILHLEPKAPAASSGGKSNEDEFMSHEVDPILDKISAHGIQSLSEREKKILQAARARMSKR